MELSVLARTKQRNRFDRFQEHLGVSGAPNKEKKNNKNKNNNKEEEEEEEEEGQGARTPTCIFLTVKILRAYKEKYAVCGLGGLGVDE